MAAGAPEAPGGVSRGKAVLRAVVNGLSIGLLALVLGLGVLAIGVPAAVGGMPLSILTGSMSPQLPPGTLVVVTPTPVEEIAVGDVITYQLESGLPTLVTHRVVGIIAGSAGDEPRFVTQGDANNARDATAVLPVQIRGVVWYSVPWLGWVNQALSGQARAWLIPVAAGGLFAYAGWMLAGGIRDRRRGRGPRERP